MLITLKMCFTLPLRLWTNRTTMQSVVVLVLSMSIGCTAKASLVVLIFLFHRSSQEHFCTEILQFVYVCQWYDQFHLTLPQLTNNQIFSFYSLYNLSFLLIVCPKSYIKHCCGLHKSRHKCINKMRFNMSIGPPTWVVKTC